MNKELTNLIKELSNSLYIKSITTSIDSCFYHQPIQINLEKYATYKIEDIISLAKIERMLDLNIITNQEKEKLYQEYNEYLKLRHTIYSCLLKEMLAEEEERTHNTKEKQDNKEQIKSRYHKLETHLLSLGIITKFNFEEAIINQIDNEIKPKIKNKSK